MQEKNNVIIKFFKGFKYAGQGIWSALKTERNMKAHIFAMTIVIILGIILKISTSEWLICMILFAGVISGEMFNTAIEHVVDMCMPEFNEHAKVAKDVAAGAVLVWAIFAAIIGGIIFLPKLLGI